jgi:hypothetical protein
MKVIAIIFVSLFLMSQSALAALADLKTNSTTQYSQWPSNQSVDILKPLPVVVMNADEIRKNLNSESKILLAKKSSKKKAKGKRRGRAKRLSGERSYKSGSSSTSIDFDAVDISGQRKTPLGSYVSHSKADLEYDFVKIRLRWHPEMIQSAASLESNN